MQRTIALLTMALLAFPVSSLAFDVSVSYDVNAKNFKQVQTGDALSFELYTDPACSDLLHSEMILAGTAALSVEKVKAGKVKGQKPKPLSPLRLRATLAPASVDEEVFLMVGGVGITPAGLTCQPQFVTGAPEPIADRCTWKAPMSVQISDPRGCTPGVNTGDRCTTTTLCDPGEFAAAGACQGDPLTSVAASVPNGTDGWTCSFLRTADAVFVGKWTAGVLCCQ